MMYPDLEPEPVLRTLMALSEFEAGVITIEKHDILSYDGGKCAKILRHPSCPPPPPPCLLDGVEYELETTNLLDKTMTQCNVSQLEDNKLRCDSEETENTLLNPLSHVNVTNKYPYPDLVPEAFDNNFQQKYMHAPSKHDGLQRENNGSTTIRDIETFFLTTVLCSTLLLLYFFPAHDPSTNY